MKTILDRIIDALGAIVFAVPLVVTGCGKSTPPSTSVSVVPGNTSHFSVPFLSRPVSAKLRITGATDVKISNKSFKNMENDVAVVIERCQNVEITECDFSNVLGGIFILDCTNVTITYNRFFNIGDNTIGSGHSNCIQFNNVTGGLIAHNKAKGGYTEDMISIFKSRGVSASEPLVIEYNQLEGVDWNSSSGSAIMLGDDGGSHIVARYNTCLNPGQVGIGVASGSDIHVIGNTVYGAPRKKSNVAIYVWNQYPYDMEDIEVAENKVRWYHVDGSENPFWNGEKADHLRYDFIITGEATNNWHADINPEELRVKL
jgi:hypothetical protein